MVSSSLCEKSILCAKPTNRCTVSDMSAGWSKHVESTLDVRPAERELAMAEESNVSNGGVRSGDRASADGAISKRVRSGLRETGEGGSETAAGIGVRGRTSAWSLGRARTELTAASVPRSSRQAEMSARERVKEASTGEK